MQRASPIFRRGSFEIDNESEIIIMYDARDAMSSSTVNQGARDLLLHLYREIGISAVAAALEVSRLSEPPIESKPEENKDLPGVLRAHDLAA